MSNKFLQFTTQYNISRQYSAHNKSQQSSLAERANITVISDLRSLDSSFF